MEDARILVVEDENVVREYIKGILEALGYQVPAAVATGEDAVKQAEAVKPDLVLMDIKLKGQYDGVDAAREISTRLDIPVIYLTSYADDDTLERAKETKPFGYIVKPFDEKELRATIEVALYKSREEKQSRQRLLEELQSTTQKISGLTRELTESAPVVSFSPSMLSADESPGQTRRSQEEKIFTIKEAAAYLEISERTIQRMLKEGIFPEPSITIDIGGNRSLRRWEQADLDTAKPHLRKRGRPKHE